MSVMLSQIGCARRGGVIGTARIPLEPAESEIRPNRYEYLERRSSVPRDQRGNSNKGESGSPKL